MKPPRIREIHKKSFAEGLAEQGKHSISTSGDGERQEMQPPLGSLGGPRLLQLVWEAPENRVLHVSQAPLPSTFKVSLQP